MVTFFEELLNIICKKYNSFTLYQEFKKLVPEEQYNDIDQMDPLTFIGCICAGNKIAIERALLVKERFNMQSNQISDINGIPNFVHATYKYFHEIYREADINDIMKTLWDFARQINENEINAETFNKIIKFKAVKVGKLSQIMYICKPNIFFSCDSTMLLYLNKNIENSYESFLQIQNFCKTLKISPYDLSFNAWEYSCQKKNFFEYIKKIDRNSYINFIIQHIASGEFERKIFQFSNIKLYEIRNNNELDILLKKLKDSIEWIKYDKANGNGIPNAILNTHYRNFISGFILNTFEDNISMQPKYWTYFAGEKSSKWNEFYEDGIMAIGWDYLGDLAQYSTQDEISNRIKQEENRNNEPMNDSKANWEFANDLQIGDIVYVKKGLDALIGRGIVKSGYIYDANRNEFKSIREVEWTHNGTFNVDFNVLDIKQWNQKTLTEISQSKYKDFCLKIEDVFMNKQSGDQVDDLKENIPLNQILYGPQGTGKTYNTILKAMSIIDNIEYKDVSEIQYSALKIRFDELKQAGQIEFVTFHQSYSYEEFVEGIKPYILQWGSTENAEIKYVGEDGIFKRMCSFKYLWENFKKNHSTPFEMKTVSDGSPFNIIEYRKDSFKVDNIGNLIPVSELEKIYELNLKQNFKIQHEIRDFISDNRYSSYCFSILQELNKPRILIIDEINRGDVSKIFGELITLIEKDKRIGNKYQMKVTLPYSKESFGVPNNLYIIGTMNTADRSIALLDTALRRRFDFEEIMPRPKLLSSKVVEGIDLQTLLTKINERITDKYDNDHQIGHSYLMGVETKEQLERAYKNRILPLLNEYFYNDSKTVAEILNCSEDELKTSDFVSILKKAQGE